MFAQVTDEEIDKFKEDNIPNKTKQATKYGVKILQDKIFYFFAVRYPCFLANQIASFVVRYFTIQTAQADRCGLQITITKNFKSQKHTNDTKDRKINQTNFNRAFFKPEKDIAAAKKQRKQMFLWHKHRANLREYFRRNIFMSKSIFQQCSCCKTNGK